MNKTICLAVVLCSFFLIGCRKSSRSQFSQAQPGQEVVENRSKGDGEAGRRGRDRRQDKKKDSSRENQVLDDSSTDNDDDISVTPRSTERRVTFWSTNGADNIQMLRESCDYNVPKTKGFANKLAGRANFSDGTFNIEQLCEIFDYCYSKWRYVNDPKGSEYLAKASETIASSLTGDCDDFAVLIASCMLAIGGDICIVTAQGELGGHAYAEVDISHMKMPYVERYIKKRFTSHQVSDIVIREEGTRKWLNLDWSGDYPGGPTYSAYSRTYYVCINGRWSYAKE